MSLAPAPWSIDPESVGEVWTNSVAILDAKGAWLAHLTRGYEGDKNGNDCPSWKNARLIAAAPKLLEAAQIVLAGLNARIDQASNARMLVPVFEGIADLHAAIAKATGEHNDAGTDDA